MGKRADRPLDDEAIELPGLDAPDEVEAELDQEPEGEVEADESVEFGRNRVRRCGARPR